MNELGDHSFLKQCLRVSLQIWLPETVACQNPVSVWHMCVQLYFGCQDCDPQRLSGLPAPNLAARDLAPGLQARGLMT